MSPDLAVSSALYSTDNGKAVAESTAIEALSSPQYEDVPPATTMTPFLPVCRLVESTTEGQTAAVVSGKVSEREGFPIAVTGDYFFGVRLKDNGMATETVLVTGASSGIGWELAKLFAADRSGVVLVARRRDKLEELAATILKLRSAGRQMVLVSLAEEEPPQLEGVITHHLPPSAPVFTRFGKEPGDAMAALRAAGLAPGEA